MQTRWRSLRPMRAVAWRRLAVPALRAVAAALPLAAPVAAQAPDAPRVTIEAMRHVHTLRDWPGLTLTVDRDAYVVVVAATRGRREAPLQLLSPTSPRGDGRVRANRQVPIRAISNADMLHLVNWGEAPLVVAFASTSRPDLTQFAAGRGWSGSLVLDALPRDEQAFVDLLGSAIFGPTATFDALLVPTSAASPLSRFADIWAFDEECLGWSGRWTRGLGGPGWGLYAWDPIDPIARGVGLMLPLGANYGWMGLGWAPIVVGGSRLGIEPTSYGARGWPCTGFRVAWWPNYVAPDAWPADSARGASDLVAPPGSPLPYIPRHPLPGRGLELAPAGATAPVAAPAMAPSAWRLGLTESERRFPGVSAEPRPWLDGKARAPDDRREAMAERTVLEERLAQHRAQGGDPNGASAAVGRITHGDAGAAPSPAPIIRREPDPAPRTTGAEDTKPQAPVRRDPPPPAP